MTRTDEVYFMSFVIIIVVAVGMALDRLGGAFAVVFALEGADRQLKKRRARRLSKDS